MNRLIASLTALLTLLVALPSSACTEPRPTGVAGSNTPNTEVIAINGNGAQIAVGVRNVNTGVVTISNIGMGPDTTLTFAGGYTGTSHATRVVKLSTHTVGGLPAAQHYWMINDTYRMDIYGVPASSGTLYNGTMYFRGASGALWGIGTGVGYPSSSSTNLSGMMEFVGVDNGSQVSYKRYFVWAPISGCADPQSSADYSRGSMLARSFFPEIESVTRQWWES